MKTFFRWLVLRFLILSLVKFVSAHFPPERMLDVLNEWSIFLLAAMVLFVSGFFGGVLCERLRPDAVSHEADSCFLGLLVGMFSATLTEVHVVRPPVVMAATFLGWFTFVVGTTTLGLVVGHYVASMYRRQRKQEPERQE